MHPSTPALQTHLCAVPPRKGEEHVLSLLSLHQAAFGLGGCEAARVWGAQQDGAVGSGFIVSATKVYPI